MSPSTEKVRSKMVRPPACPPSGHLAGPKMIDCSITRSISGASSTTSAGVTDSSRSSLASDTPLHRFESGSSFNLPSPAGSQPSIHRFESGSTFSLPSPAGAQPPIHRFESDSTINLPSPAGSQPLSRCGGKFIRPTGYPSAYGSPAVVNDSSCASSDSCASFCLSPTGKSIGFATKKHKLVEVTDKAVKEQFQALLTSTHKEENNHTRDRGFWKSERGDEELPVPTGYRLKQVWQIQNPSLQDKYFRAKEIIISKSPTQKDCFKPVIPESSKVEIKDAPIDLQHNEWRLLHGTSSSNCAKICSDGFSLACARMTSLYSQGIYFTESSTKSDEYCGDKDLCQVLVCRVIGGLALVTDRKEGIDEASLSKVRSGLVDSVVGLRPDTFNEYIVYHENQAFPEFLILYQRLWPDSLEAC